MSFRVLWFIADTEWEKARLMRQSHPPGSDYDQEYLAHYELLYGNIQFVYLDKVLFPGSAESPAGGFHLSLIDFAYGVYTILFRESFEQMPDGTATSFRQADDALEINFEKSQGWVTVTTNLSRSVALDIPEEAIVIGLKQFLAEFLKEIEHRAPELLDWESLAALKL